MSEKKGKILAINQGHNTNKRVAFQKYNQRMIIKGVKIIYSPRKIHLNIKRNF